MSVKSVLFDSAFWEMTSHVSNPFRVTRSLYYRNPRATPSVDIFFPFGEGLTEMRLAHDRPGFCYITSLGVLDHKVRIIQYDKILIQSRYLGDGLPDQTNTQCENLNGLPRRGSIPEGRGIVPTNIIQGFKQTLKG